MAKVEAVDLAEEAIEIVREGVVSDKRSMLWGGGLMALLGAALTAMIVTSDPTSLNGKIGGVAFIFIVFLGPGLLMLRSGFRSADRAPVMQLLNDEPKKLARLYLRWESSSSGVTQGKLYIVDSAGNQHTAELPAQGAKEMFVAMVERFPWVDPTDPLQPRRPARTG